ncbi:hypothetical protein [Bacillus sp. PS06]|uniref:hypothetical protein n=1 Tax=Bacillus sp. PS06 TaxID=2764176 RepID=UPI001781ED0D|nr:hypothetical protein [Bacillus sp. PS06]MBD8071178.1 hypothetical protein [Bacillus sp. PS06]
MKEPTNKELLVEIIKLNDRIDRLEQLTNEPKGLSTPVKFIALFLGFVILGPILSTVIMMFL